MKGDDIADRLLGFSALVLRIVGELPGEPAARHLGRQLTRAGTSGGANYEEARGAESRGDFAHKVLVAAKEVSESVYWLRLASQAGFSHGDRVDSAVREGKELVAILKASARTARAHDVRPTRSS